MAKKPHLLVIDAPYYTDISASLMEGVTSALEAHGASHDYMAVPGVLEIAPAIAMAMDGPVHYDGYVTIGCVIRGETTHYDVVANESARALMDLAVSHRLALGNGIQTVENEAQAWARARISDKNKGGGAAEAAIAMIALKDQLMGLNP